MSHIVLINTLYKSLISVEGQHFLLPFKHACLNGN